MNDDNHQTAMIAATLMAGVLANNRQHVTPINMELINTCVRGAMDNRAANRGRAVSKRGMTPDVSSHRQTGVHS